MFEFRRQQFDSDAIRALLERNGLGDLDEIYSRGVAVPGHRNDRAVCPVTLTNADGLETRVFVKLNWGMRRLVPRMKDIRARRVLQSLPSREWTGLEKFRGIGLNVPERLAYFEEGVLRFRAAIVISALPPSESLAERLLKGDWQRLPRDRQLAELDAVMCVMDTIHAAGLRWRGASTRHFFFELSKAGPPTPWLIDCEGVQRGGTRRDVVRDLQKLWRAFRETGADAHTLAHLTHEIERRTRMRKAA